MKKKKSIRSYQREIAALKDEMKFYESEFRELKKLIDYKCAFKEIIDAAIGLHKDQVLNTAWVLSKMRGVLK